MTPRVRVLRALAHRPPDRVPFSWGFGPTPEMTAVLQEWLGGQGIDWVRLRAATEHINWLGPDYVGPALPERTDVWGIRRKPQSYGAGSYDEFEFYPLAGVETVDQLDQHPWPSADWYDYDPIRGSVRQSDPHRTRAKKYFNGGLFETYCWMTGLEESMMNLVIRPEMVRAALERITSFYDTKLRRTLGAAGDLVDIVFLADDLGSQQGLLMGREMYREILQPFHCRLANTVRELAPHARVMFHSDGSVFDVVPDLIDAGVDILEAVQTDAAKMEPERLKSAYGDQLSFHGAISVQQLLPHSTAAEVEQGCRHVVQVLGKGGGYVAAPSHAIQVGTPPENVLAMLRAVLGEEAYQQALDEVRM